jgi:IS1 family transposase
LRGNEHPRYHAADRSEQETVAKLLIDAGKACAAYHDANVRDVKASRVQVDEIWSFTYAKQKNVAAAKAAPDHAGDTWTWTAIDADSKMILSYLVGGRDAEYAMWFMDDLASRLASRVQLTSDGHRAYLEAVEGAFGCDVDYAQLVKMYGNVGSTDNRRYSPAECTGIKKAIIEGNPDPKHVSTSFVEAHNKTMRMHMRRFTRLTNGHSKKVANHAHMVALYTLFYNFIRTHSKLRMTPAMAAGIADTFMGFEAVLERIDAKQVAKPRGPYRKREISK